MDPAEGSELKGDPATTGIAEGPACIIRVDVLDDVDKLQDGDIMVLIGEGKIGWTMFFQHIAGLVYDCGNWLCHETNLCRELGIPAVTGIDGIEAIQQGERLRIDGGTGKVYRLDFPEE